MNYYQIYKKSRFLLLVAMLLSVSWIHAQNEEIFAVEQNQEITPNQPITATRSVTITPGLDSAWLTDMSMGSAWVNPLEFIASIYYPSSTTTYTFVNSMRGTNNPKDGELQTDGTAGGSGYKPESMNLPRCGGYLVFEPQQDGSLIVPIRVFTNKPLFVTDGNGKAKTDIQFKDASGQTYTLLATTLCAVSDTEDVTGFVSFNVTKGEKYYVFSTGSKARFGGCVFSTEAIEIDPATMKDVKDILEGATATTAEPYAVLSDNNTVLTFYYDDQKTARNGMDIGPFAYLEHGFGEGQRPWHDQCGNITSVVIDASMAADTTLTSTGWWFYGCTNLKSVSGWENLHSQTIVDMWGTFEGCSSLPNDPAAGGPDFSKFNSASLKRTCYLFRGCTSMTSLDLSTFNTLHVTENEGMFEDCTALTTIYVGSGWDMTNATENWVDNMFLGCTSLVGGAGTTYDANNIGNSYAHIDGGPSYPGYLTGINASTEPTFDYNGVLTVNGQTTMQEALQTVGNVQDVVENISALVWNSSVELTEGDLENFSNPNMLIYVKGASRLDENRQNVIINGTARSVELTDSIFVNGSTVNGNFYCPEEFVAEKITFTHLYNQQTEIGVSRGWETLTLPFNVQSILNKKNGSIIAPFGNDASDKHFWLRQVGENGLTRATQIEANMPYIISMPNNPSYGDAFNQNGTVIFSAGSTVVPKTEFYAKELVIADTLRVMVFPVFQRQTATEYVYALNVGAPTGNYPEGSVFVSNLRAVNPFEVYTFHESNNHPAPMFLPLLDMEGGTTGIEELRTNSVRQDDKWYDLRGRRLSAMPTEKGIYIFNGKKIVK